jgi:hypothetical protein
VDTGFLNVQNNYTCPTEINKLCETIMAGRREGVQGSKTSANAIGWHYHEVYKIQFLINTYQVYCSNKIQHFWNQCV